MEKLSVIIPVFNSDKFLEDCLNSVINQTYKNLEIIVVNDGSEDESEKIINKYARKDKRINVINKKNEGVSIARNRGLENSTGKFVAFVDSDDTIDTFMFEKMVEELEKFNADIIECGYAEVIDKKITKEYSFQYTYTDNKLDSINTFLSGKNGADSICNKIYRKEKLEGVYLSDYKFSEDFLYNIKVLLKSQKKITIPNVFYFYNVSNENSATKNAISKNNLQDIEIRENLIEILKKQSFPEETINWIKASILKKIIFLDIRLSRSDGNLENYFTEYLDSKFKYYSNQVEFVYLKQLTPRKIVYSILIRKFNPSIYRLMLKLFFS